MNYEEKYNQALERARIEYKNEQSKGNIWVCENLSTIFPELRESEDEKIRKGILKMLSDIKGGYPFERYGILKKHAISWLEKQGEQKPSWGEEDEKMFDKLYEILYRYAYSSHPEIDLSSNEAINLISWLKSLKPQSYWKPSEEQMSMLLAVLNDSNNITAESVYIALKLLYNDLKNL